MKIQTNTLIHHALDWAVAKAEGREYRYIASTGGDYNGNWWWETRHYSTDRALCMTIVEQEGIDIYYSTASKTWGAAKWEDHPGGGQLVAKVTGCPTPLVAVCRCLVTLRLGDEIDVPEELA